MKWLEPVLCRAKSSSDVVLAVVVAAILGAMIIPLPEWALDVGIAINLAASIALLVAALSARDALEVASFPTLLLLTTLLRLALNVCSTRLALSEGSAGEIIQAFGEFVVRGDYVVGAVVFAILALVQFLVVAKGAERVAEVSARFTLDAMPGKQMSIDSELRAGAIDQEQARGRRRQLERESQLFGAMDGAMRFVKGDVIAGLVIVFINLFGGTAVGLLGGMPLSEAAAAYALIAIGDGLVSQLPSFCVSIAAGLVVTRVASEASESSLGAELGRQFFGRWKALGIVGGLCLALALLPGMPHWIFAGLATAAGAGAMALRKGELSKAAATAPTSDPESVLVRAESFSGVAPLVLDLSAELTGLATANGNRFVHVELEEMKEQLYQELGIRLPAIQVRTGTRSLAADCYALAIDEVPAGQGKLAPEGLYVAAEPKELAFLGIEAKPFASPSNGAPLSLVPQTARQRLEQAGFSPLTAGQLLCDHLRESLKRNAAAFLGVQEVQALLERLEPTAPSLVREALAKVPLALLTEVLKRLLEEQVSIRNLKAILEALLSPAAEGDAHALVERCRQALHRYLSHKYAPNGLLYASLVDPAVEALFEQSPGAVALEPEQVGALLEGVRKLSSGGPTVLISSAHSRRALRRLIEGAFPEVPVLTFGELDAELKIKPLGSLCLA